MGNTLCSQTTLLKNGFDTERLRKNLLSQKKYSALLATYFQNLPKIADTNSPEFWDEKFANETDEELFYMTIDRNTIVANEIKIDAEKKRQNQKNKYTVLNVGAGSGQLEKAVFKTGGGFKGSDFNWTGTDFTKKTLQKLQMNFPECQFVKTGIVPLPFPEHSFDTVCLLEVLEHIQPTHTFAVLKELHRVVKPSGLVIISVPINEGLEQMMPHNPNSHVRVYSKKLLRFETQVSGFALKKMIALTAFHSQYKLKKLINTFLKIRQPNNLIFVLEKK